MNSPRVDSRLIDCIADTLFQLRYCDDDTMPDSKIINEALWDHCSAAMGQEWCRDFKTASECAAMILTLALLKQIKIEGGI